MPPKRKQIDDSTVASTSTRSTRASTKASAAKNTATEAATSSAANTRKGGAKGSANNVASASGAGDDASDGMESVRSAKKARTSAPRKNKAAASRKGAQIDDEPGSARKYPSTKELPSKISNVASEPAAEPAPEVPAKHDPPVKKARKSEPYTSGRALELFSTYADSDDVNVIGPEGFEQLCTDANMPLEGSRPIIFAWQMGAREMGKISKEEWVQGMTSLKISSIPMLSLAITELEDLLIKGKPPVKSSAKKDQDYDRTSYNGYAANPKAAFQKLYQFSFSLVKPEQSRNIDMDTSLAFWTVLLVPKYPIMGDIIKFITEKGTYKATNKDLWSMMLEFCETVKPTLQDYEADGAWPTLLDDFVAWKTSHALNGNAGDLDVSHE